MQASTPGKDGKKKGVKEKPVDEDPDGTGLASVEAPLERATGYLRTLQARL